MKLPRDQIVRFFALLILFILFLIYGIYAGDFEQFQIESSTL